MGGNITAYENPDDPKNIKNIKAARYQNINIILQSVEHVWDDINRRVRQLLQSQNLVDLQRDIVHIWNSLLQRFKAGFFNEKFWLKDWRWSVWRAGGRRPQLG